jgi:hypothetical protein
MSVTEFLDYLSHNSATEGLAVQLADRLGLVRLATVEVQTDRRVVR